MRAALFLLLFFFAGCSQSAMPAKVETPYYPAWVSNPNLNGLRGAIGSSDPHFKGFTYQRQLAISRALDELAMQMGVQVDVIASREEISTGDNLSATSDIQTQQKVKNSNVTAHIEATYLDPNTGELFVWMVLN